MNRNQPGRGRRFADRRDGMCKGPGAGKLQVSKKKLKMDQGSQVINGAETMILPATGIDPLTSGTHLLEHIPCWPSFYFTSNVK